MPTAFLVTETGAQFKIDNLQLFVSDAYLKPMHCNGPMRNWLAAWDDDRKPCVIAAPTNSEAEEILYWNAHNKVGRKP